MTARSRSDGKNDGFEEVVYMEAVILAIEMLPGAFEECKNLDKAEVSGWMLRVWFVA